MTGIGVGGPDNQRQSMEWFQELAKPSGNIALNTSKLNNNLK
jgi:hypothetical protein